MRVIIKVVKKIMLPIVFLPLLYMISVATLPYIEPYFTKVAVISAGISFLDGGKSISLEKANENLIPDLIIDDLINDTEIVTYEPNVEITAPPPEKSPDIVKQEMQNVKPANAGNIQRKTYKADATGAYMQVAQGLLKNCTTVTKDKIAKTIEQKPAFDIKADGSPEVLIMHTHATESYQPTLNKWFSKEYNSRTTDNTKNVTAVGDKIERELIAAGIGVIHDRTLHDYPSYNGSYERSAATVKRILKENPTIKVVLDIHRDAIQPDSNSMISPVTTIDGKDCAQVMIISGCDNGKMNMPNYMENLKFSALLQTHMEQSYKTLTRPILFDYRKYNQDLTTGSILIEVGGHANTLEEALNSGELIGKSLVSALLTL